MKTKKLLTVLAFLGIFVLSGNRNIYCHIYINNIVDGFPEQEATTIEGYVIEGSSLFFQGMADIMILCDEGEKGLKDGILPNSINLIDSAVKNLKLSREKYLQAIRMSNSVDKALCNFTYLGKFDYDKLTGEKGLVAEIANEAKSYLSVGNVVGFYQKIADENEGLIKNLVTLKEKLGNKEALYQEDYWLILQQVSRLMLFGNYGTVMGKTAYIINNRNKSDEKK